MKNDIFLLSCCNCQDGLTKLSWNRLSGNAYFYSENIQDLIRIIECFGLGETFKVI